MPQHPGPVCVVGAGIIGLCAALELVQSGARDVIVVDAGEPLSGTTPAGAGFVARFGASGDSESGITHGPGMGKLLAQLIMNETPFVDPTPFRLDRVDPSTYPNEASMVSAMAEERMAQVAERG